MSLCCPHPESLHCKGDQRHAYYKDEARMNKHPRVHVCGTRHCNSPLCDCLGFIPDPPLPTFKPATEHTISQFVEKQVDRAVATLTAETVDLRSLWQG